MGTNFRLAPPPKTVDGLLAVPIDISTVEAAFTFDGATQTAAADVTMTYEVGPTAGNPIFDLRQTIAQAWLDGAPFPIAQLAHHVFGVGSFTDLRVIESLQAAGSVHTLRVQYDLALPNAQLGGSYLPALAWSTGPRLQFVFGLSDLNRARYAEQWLPSNLPFDQFSISIDLQIINTLAAHEVITNAAITVVGTNHWQLNFPSRFTTLSPMLEVRAADTLVRQTGSTTLPVSGAVVTIEAWMPTGSAVNLAAEITNIASFLAENENDYGPYLHDGRFVAFFNGSGGMEYEGGTTSSTSALRHETFHSWYARGVKPAAQADGWFDEGFTVFHDNGADDPLAFDFTDPPVVLCSRDPWQRHTPSNSYSDGLRFWQGIGSLLGIASFKDQMARLYETEKGNPISTTDIEAFLLAANGNVDVVDAFHRFTYGFDDASTPDLWLRDDPGHTGNDFWAGPFWDSPDLWVRNQDDDGTVHQSPEFGQDNWFYARIRNRSANTARHFMVTFHTRGFAGTEFVYPGDFLPSTTAAAGFELAPGGSATVKARWPRALVPSPGTHTCLLAAAIARADHPTAGRHVWEHNNLAQKNLTIVDLVPAEFMILPVVLANRIQGLGTEFDFEVWRERTTARTFAATVLHRAADFFARAGRKPRRFVPFTRTIPRPPETILECGAHLSNQSSAGKGSILTSRTPDLVLRRFGGAWALDLEQSVKARLPVYLPPSGQTQIGILVRLHEQVADGTVVRLHVVQRHRRTRRVVGGVALEIHVHATRRSRDV